MRVFSVHSLKKIKKPEYFDNVNRDKYEVALEAVVISLGKLSHRWAKIDVFKRVNHRSLSAEFANVRGECRRKFVVLRLHSSSSGFYLTPKEPCISPVKER